MFKFFKLIFKCRQLNFMSMSLIFAAACLFTLKVFMISFQRRMETLQHDGIFKIYNSNGSSIKWFRNRKYRHTNAE